MSLPKYENFDVADGPFPAGWINRLTNSGGTTTNGVVSNQAQAAAGVDEYGFTEYIGEAPKGNHYAECKHTNAATAEGGVWIRAAAGIVAPASGYLSFARSDIGGRLYRLDAGAFTVLLTAGSAASNDVWGISAQDSVLKLFKGGVQQGADQSDATYGVANTRWGFYGRTGLSWTADDWMGRNLNSTPHGMGRNISIVGAGMSRGEWL